MKLSLSKKSRPFIIHQSVHLYLSPSSIHGLGVFSDVPLKRGAVIETAPLLVGSAEDYDLLSKTALHDYYFILADTKQPIAIGLGFASWYNHKCPANATYSIHKKKKTIRIKAKVDIETGQEITINYHGTFNDNSPIEF
ncbi:SET domain-containing protein-lysine N-methyltransferase [Gelidibacter sp. F63206]|uniref:SET domain-containing protein-lysine N-methyltransferase n=1 Tax=Gelidibacter sp. F63206 TaxID=2926425 RepID=UPI001FF6DAC7|nr:SET domain-containing protein-lysine N-methyltransferase [Gelidibacter sp. F63206]MCK0114441.1 SET domain-containing protein-lysine N-methyltransferase [Gelidibacter sp. F63206]